MAEWMSAEWGSEAAGLAGELPNAGGASGSVSLAISSGKGRGKAGKAETGFHWTYRDGTAGGGAEGMDGEADLVLLLASEDAVAVLRGETEPSVAFMRGRLKASGDGGLLLAFLRSTADPAFEGWRQKVAALSPETSAL